MIDLNINELNYLNKIIGSAIEEYTKQVSALEELFKKGNNALKKLAEITDGTNPIQEIAIDGLTKYYADLKKKIDLHKYSDNKDLKVIQSIFDKIKTEKLIIETTTWL